MKKFEFKNNNILMSIDESIKKARAVSFQSYPYAVFLHPKRYTEIKIDNLTHFSKNGGMRSVPIIQNASLNEKDYLIAYSEEDLKQMYKK